MTAHKGYQLLSLFALIVLSISLNAAHDDQVVAKHVGKIVRVIVQISVATTLLVQIRGRFKTFGMAAIFLLVSYVITISDGAYRLYREYLSHNQKESLEEQVQLLKTSLEEKMEKIEQLELDIKTAE